MPDERRVKPIYEPGEVIYHWNCGAGVDPSTTPLFHSLPHCVSVSSRRADYKQLRITGKQSVFEQLF